METHSSYIRVSRWNVTLLIVNTYTFLYLTLFLVKTHARFLFVYVSLPKTHARFPFVSVCLQETHARFQHPPSLQEMFASHTFLQQIRSESGQFCGRCSHCSLYKKKGFQDTAKKALTCHSCWLFPLLCGERSWTLPRGSLGRWLWDLPESPPIASEPDDSSPASSRAAPQLQPLWHWLMQISSASGPWTRGSFSVSPFDSFAATLEFLPNASIFLGSRRMENCANLACAHVLAHFQVPQPSQQRKPSHQSQKKAPRSKKNRMLKMQTCKT